MITSKSNTKIKQVRALSERKERSATGLFVAEGITHVGAALDAGADIEAILYAPESLKSEYANELIKRAAKLKIPVEDVSPDVFGSVTSKDHSAGVIAIVRQPIGTLGSLPVLPKPCYVALVTPQDPGNVGTILRTIEAVGASGLILLDGGVDAYHPTAVRASLGAVFYKPIVRATFAEFGEWATGHHYNIVGTSAGGQVDYLQATYAPPLVLLMGSEQKGLSPEQVSVCGSLVRLPMSGRIDSLNLAVATGVMLYTLQNKLMGKP